MNTVPQNLIIASRESRLALWQTEHVQSKLSTLYPHIDVTVLGMTTRGDQVLDRALSQVGGKGLFVKELEASMMEGRTHMAVHSLKDVPMELPHGFVLAAILEREDPRDAFISNEYASLELLPAGAIVGTSSVRRQALIAARYPHLVIQPLRGNLDTRLKKLDDGAYAAIILAAAGLKRLDLSHRIRYFLDPEHHLPAAGQGAIAIEVLGDRTDLLELLRPLNHFETAQAVCAERTVSRCFGGNCHTPLAAFATAQGADLRLRALVATLDGTRVVAADVLGSVHAPEVLGDQVVTQLKEQGAEAILAECEHPG